MYQDPGPDEADLRASLDDAERFGGIFLRRVDEIYRFIWLRVGEAAAEDLTADVFSKAFASRNQFDPSKGSVRVWLYSFAASSVRHHLRAEYRRRARELRALAADSGIASEGADGAASDWSTTRAAVEALSPRLRDVVLVVAGADLTYSEAAMVLGISIGTVRSRYSRARKQLQHELAARHQRPSAEGASA